MSRLLKKEEVKRETLNQLNFEKKIDTFLQNNHRYKLLKRNLKSFKLDFIFGQLSTSDVRTIDSIYREIHDIYNEKRYRLNIQSNRVSI